MQAVLDRAPQSPAGVAYYNTEALLRKLFTLPDDRIREQIPQIALKCFTHEFVQAVKAAGYEKCTEDFSDDMLVNHAMMVAYYAVQLGGYLRLSGSILDDLCIAAQLHDIGKKYINPSIAYKKHRFLSDSEKRILSTHTAYGQQFVRKQFPSISTKVGMAILKHHESAEISELSGFNNYSHIIAIADRYVRCITEYKELRTQGQILEFFFSGNTSYNIEYCQVFFDYIFYEDDKNEEE